MVIRLVIILEVVGSFVSPAGLLGVHPLNLGSVLTSRPCAPYLVIIVRSPLPSLWCVPTVLVSRLVRGCSVPSTWRFGRVGLLALMTTPNGDGILIRKQSRMQR